MLISNITILIFYSSKGIYNYGYGIDILVNHWIEHLNYKFQTNVFPFRTNVELVDYQSNLTFIDYFFKKRLISTPEVSAILAPEGPVGRHYASFASSYGIPYILTTSNPSPIDNLLPADETTSFYIQSQPMYTFRTLIDEYVKLGVKTLATVVYNDDADAGYNYWSCYGTATYLGIPRGIKYVAQYTLYSNSTQKDVYNIAKQLQKVNPDAILWCDWQSWTFSDYNSTSRFGLSVLKDINYISKTITFLDCFNTVTADKFIHIGLLDFIMQGTFTDTLNLIILDQPREAAAVSYGHVTFKLSKIMIFVN
jgi:hypothetical protein